MVELREPIEVELLTDLEAKRRTAQKALAQLQAPGKALVAAQAQLSAVEDAITTRQAAEEAQRRAEQQRADELVALQRRYADLAEPVKFGAMELRDYLLLVHHIGAQLRERGGVAAPIVLNLEDAARPLIEMQEKIQEALRQPVQRPVVIDTTEEGPTDEHG